MTWEADEVTSERKISEKPGLCRTSRVSRHPMGVGENYCGAFHVCGIGPAGSMLR